MSQSSHNISETSGINKIEESNGSSTTTNKSDHVGTTSTLVSDLVVQDPKTQANSEPVNHKDVVVETNTDESVFASNPNSNASPPSTTTTNATTTTPTPTPTTTTTTTTTTTNAPTPEISKMNNLTPSNATNVPTSHVGLTPTTIPSNYSSLMNSTTMVTATGTMYPSKGKKEPSTDPWTYAKISLSDVRLKHRGIVEKNKATDAKDYSVSSIKGVDVSALKYNDLRKICVRLRCPNYKNQNKEGMLQLITIAKMKEDGLLPQDYAYSSTQAVPLPMPSSSTSLTSALRVMNAAGTGQLPLGVLQELASNTNANVSAAMAMKRKHDIFNPSLMPPTGKRSRVNDSANVTTSNSPMSLMPMMNGTGFIGGAQNMGTGLPEDPSNLNTNMNISKPGDDVLLSIMTYKVEEAKLSMVNFDRFCKVSDRVKSLRTSLKDETDETNKKEIEEELVKMKAKKEELSCTF